jgi:hypothetical protein
MSKKKDVIRIPLYLIGRKGRLSGLVFRERGSGRE